MMKPDASYNDGMKPIYYSDAETLISGAVPDLLSSLPGNPFGELSFDGIILAIKQFFVLHVV